MTRRLHDRSLSKGVSAVNGDSLLSTGARIIVPSDWAKVTRESEHQ